MSNPTAAMLVIGDEILSGRTRDSNTHHLAQSLTRHGIELKEARVVADEPEAIAGSVRALSRQYDHVFTSGGIGPTHDDITADCIAAAFDAPIGIRDDARAILKAHCDASGLELNAARLRMARIPDGAALIENPVSAAPGFTIGNVHVMAGVPAVFRAMVAVVVPRLSAGTPILSQTLQTMVGEGTIAEALGALNRDFPDLSMGSYPFRRDGSHGTNIVIRGTDVSQMDRAMELLKVIVGRLEK